MIQLSVEKLTEWAAWEYHMYPLNIYMPPPTPHNPSTVPPSPPPAHPDTLH